MTAPYITKGYQCQICRPRDNRFKSNLSMRNKAWNFTEKGLPHLRKPSSRFSNLIAFHRYPTENPGSLRPNGEERQGWTTMPPPPLERRRGASRAGKKRKNCGWRRRRKPAREPAGIPYGPCSRLQGMKLHSNDREARSHFGQESRHGCARLHAARVSISCAHARAISCGRRSLFLYMPLCPHAF